MLNISSIYGMSSSVYFTKDIEVPPV